MFKFYLKQSWKNLGKTRLITIGSILTLFTGVLSISLLVAYVHNELSMDKFHKRSNDIYMTVIQSSAQSNWEAITINRFFDFKYQEYPVVESITTVKKYLKDELKLNCNQIEYTSEGMVTDSNFFKVFDFKLKAGNASTVLYDEKTILLAESFAKKIFGDEDPIGKNITVTARTTKEYTVNGILADPPSNSSISFDFILPDDYNDPNNFNRSGANFLLVRPGFNKAEFLDKIKDIGQSHSQFSNSKTSLRAFTEIYFGGEQAEFNLIFSKTGDKKSSRIIFIIIGILFFVSVLNFSNLQIVNINSTIKNIGINKISGARGIHLFYLKLTEILILTCVSAILISLVFISLLPLFNNFIGVQLSPPFIYIFLLLLMIILVIIVLAMVYPAITISKLPIKLSLSNQSLPNKNLFGKQAIIISQFVLTICLLISSMVVMKQINMMLHKDLGFNTQNVIKTALFHELPRPAFIRGENYNDNQERTKEYRQSREKQSDNYQFAKNELASFSAIEGYSQQYTPLESYQMPWKTENDNMDYTSHYTLTVNPGHFSVFDFEMVEGRFFDAQLDQERGNKVVINEAAKKYWEIEDISQTFINNSYWQQEGGYEIIGVVKNFDFYHLSAKHQPLVMVYFEDIEANFLIRFAKGATNDGLAFVEGLNNKINPDRPFKYSFVSDEVTALYQKEKRLSKIYIIFTLVAFLISMNGLFTIALYDTAKRTKEIGVRKVNGSGIKEIMYLLNRDFIKWVVIAYFIAAPFSWYIMHKWIESFAYKTEISWWVFSLAGILALGIALLTVSWQSWVAARKNPVEALRYE